MWYYELFRDIDWVFELDREDYGAEGDEEQGVPPP